MTQLVLTNGDVWTGESGLIRADVMIADGRIAALGTPGTLSAEENVDVSGLTVLPGAIDAHIHLGHGSDISRPRVSADATSETAAAAVGGVTTFISYVLSAEPYRPVFDELCSISEAGARVDFAFHFVIATLEQLGEVPWLCGRGAPTVKLFMNIRRDEGKRLGLPGTDDGFLFQLLEALKGEGGMLCPHPENIEVGWVLRDRVLASDPEGAGGLSAWNATRPPFVEAEALSRAAYFARIVGCPIHGVHTSSAEALRAGLAAKASGSDISIETCTQYLTHDIESPIGIVGKVNPPLREPTDRDALWAAVRKGQIDTIATDHIHRPLSSKEGGTWKAQPGFPGLDTFLPALLTEAAKRDVPLGAVIPLVSENPARRMGLGRKGTLRPGFDADIAVVDLNAHWTVERDALASDAGYSIYEGQPMTARVVHTLSRGAFALRDGVLDDTCVGRGRYVPRRLT